MSASIVSGPRHSYGSNGNVLNSSGVVLVPDPNPDSGPDLADRGWGILDLRFFYPKDKVIGESGVVPSYLPEPNFDSVNAIPAQFGTANIAAAAAVVNGTAMTLAGASTGITLNVPIVTINGIGDSLNGNPVVTAAIALDFGFAFGNVTAGTAAVQVADSSQFREGMPLVIGGVGNSGGTVPLLTQVQSITDATHITLNPNALPLATNATAPIGTGNMWGPGQNGFPLPTAALPMQARGPALFLDPTQAIARGVSITASAGAAGGAFIVSGADVYGDTMTEQITAVTNTTVYGNKAFKYIFSVTPQFTDAGGTYSVGTSDVFGVHARSTVWEYTNFAFGGTFMSSSTGWLTADTTSPSTSTTGDVRGTLQTSSNGGGSPMTGGAASNGSIVSLAMSGRRLFLNQQIAVVDAIRATVTNPAPIYGVPQN